MSGKIRISILDAFRAIAIISVMLYHYFSRWTPPISKVSLYPYDGKFNFFGLGYLGVQFFFIISGFVIFFTLEKTESLIIFWKKRMIRLLPSILFASLLILLFFNIFDRSYLFPASHAFQNLIPSLSFIKPSLFNDIFHVNLAYVNGSYWSLWPEIQFYILSSIIYYLNKKSFLKNFMMISIALISVNYILHHISGSNKLQIELPAGLLAFYNKWVYNGFNLISYLPFFCLGVLFYKLSMKRKENLKTSIPFKICLFLIILFTFYSGTIMSIRIIYLLMIVAFLIFIYFPEKISFLEKTLILNVGESSYFLYLIHESLGVLIINILGPFILPGTFLLPLILIIGFSYFSILFTKKIDQPLGNWLKSKIIKPTATNE